MTAIIDYGVGNLFSISCSLDAIGEKNVITGDKQVLMSADRIILPGVGAFRDAISKLRSTELDKTVLELAASGKPLLGICLGMQMLFDKSFEYGEYDGLGLIPGSVRPIADEIPNDLKIPHIGWNALVFTNNNSRIFKYIKDGDHVYFVHSYHACDCDEYITAKSEYGASLCASVERGNVFGCQFHPEKSGNTGLSILKAFCEIN